MSPDDLVAQIDAFLKRDDVHMSESTFGRRAVNDGKLIERLRDGGSVTLKTLEKIKSFISGYKPPVPVSQAEVAA